MVTVSRTIQANGCTITESVTASLPDNLTLDDATESGRRCLLAQYLFASLPSLPSQSQPKCTCPPINLKN